MTAASMPPTVPDSAPHRRRDWDGVAAIIAAFVGLLALCVSGYTAYVQRQQVRAQVWPFLEAGNDDSDQSLVVYSKGVGPAIVKNAQIRVDGKPQRNWDQVYETFGIDKPHTYSDSTLSPNVLSPGEQVRIIKFPEADDWKQFRAAAIGRLAIDVCFCSTLGECWMYSDPHLIGHKSAPWTVTPREECPRLPPGEVFSN